MTEDTLRLLKAAHDLHDESAATFGPGTELDLAGASGRVGTSPGSLLWEACVAELEREGMIAQNPVARHAKGGIPYVVTLRGVRLLRGTNPERT